MIKMDDDIVRDEFDKFCVKLGIFKEEEKIVEEKLSAKA